MFIINGKTIFHRFIILNDKNNYFQKNIFQIIIFYEINQVISTSNAELH